jgi:hypothetical protein
VDQRPQTTVELTGAQKLRLSNAICDRFTLMDLQALLSYRLDRRLDEIVPPNANLRGVVLEIIEAAGRESWMADLLHAVAAERPALQGLVHELLASPAADPDLPAPTRIAYPPNPFGDAGRITDPARFHDREELLRTIFEEVDKHTSLSLVGEAQVGKSSILSMICHHGPQRMTRRVDRFAVLDMELVKDEGDFYEALCLELSLPETLRGYRLTRALNGQQFVLCLDEIEKMTWEGFTVDLRSYLRGLADGADRPLTLVIASRRPLADIFDAPSMVSPLANICHQVNVMPFSPEEARRFVLSRLAGAGVAFSPAQIEILWRESHGHPARLQRAAADLYRQLINTGR